MHVLSEEYDFTELPRVFELFVVQCILVKNGAEHSG